MTTQPTPAPTTGETPRTDALDWYAKAADALVARQFSSGPHLTIPECIAFLARMDTAQAALAAKDREIAELRDKLATCVEQRDRHWQSLKVETARAKKAEAERDQLRARVADLEQDKERLDWLEKVSRLERGNCDRYEHDEYLISVRAGSGYYTSKPTLSLRAAIDHARSPLPESGKDQP